MKNVFTVEIAGVAYRLVADSDQGHLDDLAAMINDRIEALGPKSRLAAPAQRLALVALGLAEDLEKRSRQSDAAATAERSVIRAAIAEIDSALAKTEASLAGPSLKGPAPSDHHPRG